MDQILATTNDDDDDDFFGLNNTQRKPEHDRQTMKIVERQSIQQYQYQNHYQKPFKSLLLIAIGVDGFIAAIKRFVYYEVI
jgi:hypothetical protein